jgi:hypothetical protein
VRLILGNRRSRPARSESHVYFAASRHRRARGRPEDVAGDQEHGRRKHGSLARGPRRPDQAWSAATAVPHRRRRAGIGEGACRRQIRRRCCSGRCSPPVRSTCARSMAGTPWQQSPSISQLTSLPDPVLFKCRRSRHRIPTQLATAPQQKLPGSHRPAPFSWTAHSTGRAVGACVRLRHRPAKINPGGRA